MFLLLLSALLFASYALLIFFYKKGWDRLVEFKPKETFEKGPFISVLIAARNEEKNIAALLQSLEAQTYPKHLFEVIVVDDHSEDNTVAEVKRFGNANVKIVQLMGEAAFSSKKKGIQKGVACATGELIVTTDADCTAPPGWLSIIASFYLENKFSFLAAPVAYRSKNTLLEVFQTIDFITLQGITAASVAAHFHAMCNGANLAYTKQAFIEAEGFKDIDAKASGDDMLLMYKIWKKHPKKVHYLKSKNAIVQTTPMPTWKEFYWQRIRWASKTTYYQDKRVFLALLLIYLFNVLFLVLAIAGFFYSFYWLLAFVLLAAKAAAEAPLVYRAAVFYEQQKILWYFLLLQPLHILYTISIGLLSQFGKYKWKGRRTK